VDVRWLDLRIRADELPGTARPAEGIQVPWLVGGLVAVVVLFGGGWAAWRRARRAQQ